MELIQLGKKTYYIKNHTNIGVYLLDDTHVYLIDTGNDKDAGKKILKIIEEQGWQIVGIINTHSHADHTGGNHIIQERTNATVYNYQLENVFTEYPLLEPSFLYGGFPMEQLKNKFLYAQTSHSHSIENNLPTGLEYISLKGHSFHHIGIKTDDEVYFLGDSIISIETIEKYHIFYLCDIKETLHSLDILETLKGNWFIASHVEATKQITSIIEENRNQIHRIIETILEFCREKITFETLLKKIFEHFDMNMNLNQYFLISCTLRSYISYLCNEQKLNYFFENNTMFYQTV